MNRREFVFTTTAMLAANPWSGAVHAEEIKEIRIGYQKSGVLPLAKQQGRLETRFEPLGLAVKWIEFPFGPPLLEALNVGSIDYGTTGDAPPIFAQAAKANLLYVAALPASGQTEAILVPEDSPIRSLADLKGKRIGVAKASSAHNTTVAALEKAGLSYADVTPVFLPPADAAAAFARGAIDAWTIWDPYYAIAQRGKVRVLAEAAEVHRSNSFFLANREFTVKHPELVGTLNDELAKASIWAETHHAEVAAFLSEATGVDAESERKSVDRTAFRLSPVTDEIIAVQQRVADRFYKLGLIPKPVVVRDIVWKWTPSA
ncbi:sulfonate transport system substrate-binding protein [Rhizobiales bacterium GAS191]|nr:sulfonate transport system substrate-binding protein [Rhizobiales bacterium GAS191]